MREQPTGLTARVAAIVPEAADVVSVFLDSEPAGLPPWEPGAHIDLILPDDLERQYSLCGDPAAASWQVAVLRERPSRGGSELIHTQLRVGDEVRVRGPRNGFPLVDARSYLFIAGGIGVTPLLPMVRHLAGAGAQWRMVYGGRRRASMAFVDELTRFGNRVTVWPEDEMGLIDLEALLGRPDAATAVYCCGPEPLLAAVERCCERWPPGALHLERFHPKPGALEGVSTAFEVVLSDSGITVEVAANQSIVEALEAAGVTVATSCREGTCGTCETDILEGIPDHRDSFLSEEEKAEGATIMICCSRALSHRLVLAL